MDSANRDREGAGVNAPPAPSRSRFARKQGLRMHQILFHVPILKDWFPPDGFPLPGFGAMLFVAFVVCTLWASRRGQAIGMKPERVQDLVIWLFFTGIIRARVLYMIQYSSQFPDKSPAALLGAFFQIWKGGIIFYG